MNWTRHARLAWAALSAFLVVTSYVFIWNKTIEFHHSTFAVLSIAGMAAYIMLCGASAIEEWVHWNNSPVADDEIRVILDALERQNGALRSMGWILETMVAAKVNTHADESGDLPVELMQETIVFEPEGNENG